MKPNMDEPQTPPKYKPGTEHPSENPTNDRDSPIIRTEDSYFADGPVRSGPPNDFRELGLILNKRRATQHVAIRGVGAAWIDQDDSGTYDPKKERATPPATPPPRRRRRSPTDDDDEDRPRPRKSHRRIGYRSLLTFSFTSQKALDYLKSISPGPYDSRTATPEDELSDSTSEAEENDMFGPPLKCRKTRRSTRQRSTLPRDDGLTIDQLTLGHPQRRGCRACFEVGDDHCSLIEDGHKYPCTACDDAGFDCEFIIPPELKKSCERCKQKRISCSYRLDGGKGVSSCKACEEADEKCIAAPLKSSASLARAAPAGSSSPAPSTVVPEKVFVACNQCRNNSLRCNLKRGQPGPCRNCKKNKEECAFVLKPIARSVTPLGGNSKRIQEKGEKKRAHRQQNERGDPEEKHTPGHLHGRNENQIALEAHHYYAARHKPSTNRRHAEKHKSKETERQAKIHAKPHRRSASRSYTPEVSAPLGIRETGIQHIRIKTAFCHPITFNYQPDPMGTSPCSWCSSPFFGLFGHGELEVEVIPYPQVTGHGYEELPGGHADNEKQGSQMCVPCTDSRIRVMACAEHVLEAIDIDPRLHVKGEMEKSVQALLVNDKKGGSLAEETRWCSICPSFASFKCSASSAQPEDDALRIGGHLGCGLFLCENCCDLMTKIAKDGRGAGETLNRTINHASKDRFNYEYGVRADASFLTSKGELQVRLDKGFGMDPVVDDQEVVSSGGAESDQEIIAILERVGEGRGMWMEKQKVVPAVKKGGQWSAPQKLTVAGNGGLGRKSKAAVAGRDGGQGKSRGGRMEDYFKTEDCGTTRGKSGGYRGEPSGVTKRETGLGSKGEKERGKR